MYNILICDDQPDIVNALKIYLSMGDYRLFEAYTGRQAVELVQKEEIHLILMDIMMPEMDGIAATQRIREFSNAPIILLTAKSENEDKVLGLNVGADDYITKPFRPLVLGAKVKALIRRNKNMVLDHSDVLDCGPFTYNTSTMRFYKGEKEISLSSKENSLMLLFMKHPGQVFTKDMIYEHVWGTSVAVDDNAIMVYINRLRGKIEEDRQKPEHIVTVRGLGYRFIP